RIFRITPAGHKGYTVPKVDLTTKEGVLAALGSPNLAVRHMATSHLRSLPAAESWPILEKALAQRDDPTLRARAFWQLAEPAYRDSIFEKLQPALKDDDPRFRALAVRILRACHNRPRKAGEQDVITPAILKALADDPSPAVRRETLLMLRDIS